MEIEKMLVIVAFILTLIISFNNLVSIQGASTSLECEEEPCAEIETNENIAAQEKQIFYVNAFMIVIISSLFMFYIWSNHARW
jgi:hypothetical protein